MENIRLAACLALLPLLPLSAVAIDFAPLKVGNEWVYQGQARVQQSWSGPDIQFRETVRLRVAARHVRGDSVLWDLAVRDSLSDREFPAGFPPGPGGSLADTVLVGSLLLLERGDSLRLVGASAHHFSFGGPLPRPAFHSNLDLALTYNGFFRHHILPVGMAMPIGADPEGRAVWQATLGRAPWFGGQPVTAWYIDGVGLHWIRTRSQGGCDGMLDRELILVRFNGKAVDAGATPADRMPPLAKGAAEAKIACPVRRVPGARAVVSLRQWDIDLNGRVVIAPEGAAAR